MRGVWVMGRCCLKGGEMQSKMMDISTSTQWRCQTSWMGQIYFKSHEPKCHLCLHNTYFHRKWTKSSLLFILKVFLMYQHFGWWKYFTPKSKQNGRCFIWKLLLLGTGEMAPRVRVLFVLLWGSVFRPSTHVIIWVWPHGYLETQCCVQEETGLLGLTGRLAANTSIPGSGKEPVSKAGGDGGGYRRPSSGLYTYPVTHVPCAHTTLSRTINYIRILLYFTPMFIMELLL